MAREKAFSTRTRPRLGVAAQLVGVEQVDLRVAAAEEQQRRAHGDALVALRGTVLQEAAERREPGPRPDHDHRRVRVLRRVERDAGRADEDEDGAVLRQVREVSRADPGERAGAGAGRPAQHADGDAAGVRAGQGRGGDGVVARAQRRQHVEELRERQRAGREGLQQVEQRPVRREHLVAVVVAGQAPRARPAGPRPWCSGRASRCRRGPRRPAAPRSWRAPRAAVRARRSAGGCASRCSG